MSDNIKLLIDDHLPYVRDLGFGFNNFEKLIYIAKGIKITFSWEDIKYDIIPFLTILNNLYGIEYVSFRMNDRLFKYYITFDDVLNEIFPDGLDLEKLDLFFIKIK